MNRVKEISIAGTGNVGYHLARHLVKRHIRVSYLLARRSNQSEQLATELNATLVTNASELPNHQLLLLCVPDDQIAPLLSEIDNSIPVAYTSGSVQLEQFIGREHLGVFYPLQTFTRSHEINIDDVPFFIEANNTLFRDLLRDLAQECSSKVVFADSSERKEIHLTAVIVNNFTNHLMHIAKEYSEKNGINFDHFKPLLKETVSKLDKISPYEAQTGPARRNDLNTIEEHLKKLEGRSKDIYLLMTNSIKETYNSK